MKRTTKQEPSKQETKASAPMDASVTEAKFGTPRPNTFRVCYAAKTLVNEVDVLYPEIPVEYSNIDGRNTALDVTFDLTVLDSPERDTLAALLELVETDSRVSEVITEDGSAVLVSFIGSPRTQDIRDPFGLGDALLILDEGHDYDTEDYSDIGGSL